jgi:hypothetical protein
MRIFRQNDTWYAALRIAIGARLISGAVFDPMLADLPEEPLGTELNGALTILEKLLIMSRYWDELTAADIQHHCQHTIDGFRF